MNEVGNNQAYDAFGDKLPLLRARRGTTIRTQAGIAAIAVFWSLALLLVAGRVHFAPSPAPAAIELAAR